MGLYMHTVGLIGSLPSCNAEDFDRDLYRSNKYDERIRILEESRLDKRPTGTRNLMELMTAWLFIYEVKHYW